MKVHLIKKETVYQFISTNPTAAKPLTNWLRVLKGARWSEPNEMIKSFRNIDILGKGSKRVIFDIGGNKYRCICTYKFGKSTVYLFINWIGTHTEYDKICKDKKQYTISIY